MNQEKAVKMMMLDIKVHNVIPERYYPYIRERLALMWLVGHEAQVRSYPLTQKRKPVRVLNKAGEKLGDFDSPISAATFMGVAYSTAKAAARRGNLIKDEFYVRYLK